MRPASALLLAALLGGCDVAVTGLSHGPPIATLGGQLSLAEGLQVQGDVRLAIAWYPDLSPDTPSPPKSIATEEVRYTGTFPQAYSFRLFAPPPAEALAVDLGEDGAPEAKAALGQLLAYEDLDGNGRLSLDAQGRATDRILGSTAGAGAFDVFTTATRYLLVWLQDGATLELQGTKQGYNLVRFRDPFSPPEVLPLGTPIPLKLTAEPRLGLIACPEAYLDSQPEVACGGRVWSTPEVGGSIMLRDDGGLDALVLVQAGGLTRDDATVRINGTLVPAGPFGGAHELSEAVPGVLHPGLNTVEVALAGYDPVGLQVLVPGRFEWVTPAEGARVSAAGTVDASWTAASGATRYGVSLYVEGPQDQVTELVTGTSERLPVPDAVGPGTLSILAYGALGFSRTQVTGFSVRVRTVDVVR